MNKTAKKQLKQLIRDKINILKNNWVSYKHIAFTLWYTKSNYRNFYIFVRWEMWLWYKKIAVMKEKLKIK